MLALLLAAAPVYLTCAEATRTVEIVLDEAKGTAVEVRNGTANTYPAVFTATKVVYGGVHTVDIVRTIDRTDLTIATAVTFDGEPGATRREQCTLTKPPKRAF